MKYSIVNRSLVNFDDRIDAEYYRPDYLQYENTLQKLKAQPLTDFAKLTSSAFYPAATHLYKKGSVPFIRCVDCINYPIISKEQNESFERIPSEFLAAYNNIKSLRKNDIIITKVGSPCYASIILEHDEVALSRTVLGVYSIQKIDPFYLIVYLRSKYGFSQLFRERELTIQYQLTLDRVGRIHIYKPANETLEKIISDVLKTSYVISKEANLFYKSAENSLFSELGLANWQPKQHLSFVKPYSQVEDAGRFDAEYFQPKYDEAISILKRKDFQPLNEITTLKKGVQARSLDGDVPYASIKDIVLNQIETNEYAGGEKLVYALPESLVLAITGATIGKSAMNIETHPIAICGDLVSIKTKEISPYYLLTVLTSPMIQSLCVRDTTGATNGHLSVSDVSKFPIPLLPPKTIKNIEKHVINSFESRIKSKSLLEIAKRGVEIAIEQNEVSAEKWIREEVDKIGLKNS